MGRIIVRLTPRASRSGIEKVEDGIVHARVTAAPVKGAANEALRELLAEALRIAKSSVSIRSGATSRIKTLEIQGLATEDALALLRERA